MPSTPIIVNGTITDSNGNNSNKALISFVASSGSIELYETISDGKYLVDLINIGVSKGDTVTYSVRGLYNNEIYSSSFIANDFQTINITLVPRKEPITVKGNRDNQLYNIGAKAVSKSNPLPVTVYDKDNKSGVLINGVDYTPGRSGVDSATEILSTIEYEHHEIHAGSHFFICGYTTLGNAGSITFTVITPNTSKWSHMIFFAEGSQSIVFTIKEGAAVDATGTPVVSRNSDRNSSNTSSLVVRTGDTFTGEGTSIFAQRVGANKVIGSIRRDREIILKQNTTYIFRITNTQTTDTVASYCGEWYEHTNKN